MKKLADNNTRNKADAMYLDFFASLDEADKLNQGFWVNVETPFYKGLGQIVDIQKNWSVDEGGTAKIVVRVGSHSPEPCGCRGLMHWSTVDCPTNSTPEPEPARSSEHPKLPK